MKPDPARKLNEARRGNEVGMAIDNIVIMATTIVKLKAAADRGDGLALTNSEVKAVMFALKTLKEGRSDARP